MIARPEFGKGAAIALGVFVLINAALAMAYGVRIGEDSGIYVDGAALLNAGQSLTARQPSYAGYISFVSVFDRLGLGLQGVVAGQVLAATVAAAMMFFVASTIGGARAGVAALLLLAVDVETNRWHAYVLSDSLFTSALAVVTWLAYRAAVSRRAGHYAVATVAMIAASLIRPEGWFLVPAAVAYWLVRLPLSVAQRSATVAVLVAACAAMVSLVAPRLGGNVQAVGPSEMLRQGQTIWDFDGWRVTMPPGPAPRPDASSAVNAIDYAISHPFSTIKLMATRVVVHFAHVRPFFSTAHNLVVALWLLPVYACAAIGVAAAIREPLTVWCATVLATQTLVVALTHADWDGRYLAHVMFLIYPFAALGLVRVAERLQGSTKAVAIA